MCLTLCDQMDCSPPGSSVHGIYQARILEWVDISSFMRSFQPRNQNHIPCISHIDKWILYHWATWKACHTNLSCCCCCSVAQSCLTLCDPMGCIMPGFPVLHHLPELAQTHVHWVCNAIQPSHPLVPFSSCLQSFPASGSFPMMTLQIRWPKYWSFSFSMSPSNEYSGLIFFRIDWFDLLAVQGTLKSLLQHHNSKATFQRSAFFMVQLSHPCMTTGKTIALTRWTSVSKVMSLLFNMLSKFVIAFLPRSKCSASILPKHFFTLAQHKLSI